MRPPEELHLPVRLTPRGGRDAIDGVSGGILLARVAAAPVDGAANVALLRLIAAQLEVPPSAVHLMRGATSRTKVVVVEGIDADRIRRRWPGLGV